MTQINQRKSSGLSETVSAGLSLLQVETCWGYLLDLSWWFQNLSTWTIFKARYINIRSMFEKTLISLKQKWSEVFILACVTFLLCGCSDNIVHVSDLMMVTVEAARLWLSLCLRSEGIQGKKAPCAKCHYKLRHGGWSVRCASRPWFINISWWRNKWCWQRRRRSSRESWKRLNNWQLSQWLWPTELCDMNLWPWAFVATLERCPIGLFRISDVRFICG